MRHAAQQLSLHCPHITSCLKYRQYLALPYKVKMHNTFQSFSKPRCPPSAQLYLLYVEAGLRSPAAPSPPRTCPQSRPGVPNQGDSASHRSDGGDLGNWCALLLLKPPVNSLRPDPPQRTPCRSLWLPVSCGESRAAQEILCLGRLGREDHFGVAKLCIAIGCTLCGAVFAKGMPSTSTVLAGQGCLETL